MRRIIMTGAGLLALLAALVSCTGAGVAGPAIDSISAELSGGVTTTVTTSPTSPTTSPTITTPTTTPTTPTATSPLPGEGMSVTVTISVSDFEVVTSVGGTDGDGYFIYYLDRLPAALAEEIGTTPITTTPTTTPTTTFPTTTPTVTTPTPTTTPTTPGQPQEMAFASTDTSFTWEDLAPGVHIFSVQLVDIAGAPLVPPVVAGAAITIPAS